MSSCLTTDEEAMDIAKKLDIPFEDLRRKVKSLFEFNPMLGHRGCRLAVTYPEIYQMQARAIAEAAGQLVKAGKKLVPEIMIPLVGVERELEIMRKLVDDEVKHGAERNVGSI